MTHTLTNEDRDTLLRDGFLLKRGLAGRERAEAARRLINAHVGKNGIDPAKLATYSTQTYCPEIRDDPLITGLVNNDDVGGVIDELIGLETLKPVGGGQIALRFPRPPSADDGAIKAKFDGSPGYHIDGVPYPNNGVPEGEVHNFTCLVGVLLNDQPTPWRGNFTAWPGSHDRVAAHLREHGVDDLAGKKTPHVADGPGTQVTGEAGDVVFANHLTLHGIAPNLSPEVRYNCFFRLWSNARGRYAPEPLTDPWREWKVG